MGVFTTTASGKEHKENPNLPGAGALHDLGSHLVDQATQLLGMPNTIFADVFSMKGKDTANDYFDLLLYYPQDVRLRLKASVFTKEDHYAYKLHGSRGSFLQERSDNQESELVAGSKPVYNTIWTKERTTTDGILNILNEANETERTEHISSPGDYMSYYQEIYEALVFSGKVPSPAVEIVQNMKIIDAALESSRLGQKINTEV